MKHPFPKLAVVTALAIAALSANAQSVTINLGGGIFSTPAGTALVENRLIQLIASTTDDVFNNPTSTSFISGDDLIIASFGLDSLTGTGAGTFQAALPIQLSGFTNLNAGDRLLLRWFDIAYVPGQMVPGVSSFGQYRSDSSPDGSDPWVMKSAGDLISLVFITEALGGTNPDSAGYASSSTSPIPEPSTYAAIFGAGVLGFAVYRRRMQSKR